MIPRYLHHIWVGDPMPGHLAGYVATWADHHPDWLPVMWGEHELDELDMQNRDLYDRAEQLVGPTEVGQFRADIARLEILYNYGGVYVDCDMEALRAIDALCDVDCFAAFEDPDGRWVNNAVMGAEPWHPFIARLIHRLPDSVARARVRRPNLMSGPQFVTPVWREADWPTVRIYPYGLFYPYSWSELDRQGEEFPDAYAVHHWHHRRTTRATSR